MSEGYVRKPDPFPELWRGRRVGVLDALMWGRYQVRERRAFWSVTGFETVESFFPFIRGWNANTHFNGGYDLAWQEFLEWFQETQGETLSQDWCVKWLRDCQGDQERAALVLLDLAAEYAERFGVVPRGRAGAMDEKIAALYGPLPREWGGRPVETLDSLLWIRRRMLEGQPLSFITGENTIESLYCFFNGWLRNTCFNNSQDVTVEPFQNWLRDAQKENRGEGWHAQYLRACQGDHRKAVLKFLDAAAEFMASR
jgi:hypothetical protein